MNLSNNNLNYQQEITELQRRLEEANDIIEAIRTGAVDALIVNGEDGHQLYTLKTADQTYRVFIEKMNEGAVTLNKEGLILYSNSRFAKMIELPLSKVIGKSFIDLVHKEDRNRFLELITKGWHSESKGELFLQGKNGKLLSSLVSLTTLELDEGTALSIIIADLSAQKKIQAELKHKNEELEKAQQKTVILNAELEDKVQKRTQKIKEAEERARLAVESGNMGTFDLNLKTDKFITSPRVDSIFGMNSKNPHSSFVKLIHPDDLPLRNTAHQKAIETGRLYYDARIIWENNSVHWIRVQGKVFYDEQGHGQQLLGTIIDITDQKNAEESLMNINQRLEIALEAGKLGSYEMDTITGEIECTDQCRANYGLSVTARFSYPILLEMVMPLFREKVKQAISEAIANNNIYNQEYQVQWPDGSIHWIKASGKIKHNNDGNAAKIIGVTFDITDHKELQQQKDDFIGIASHELKTPVTSIKAYTQLLGRMLLQKGDSREAGMVTKMDNQITRLTNLIGDLLDVTKINSGKLQFNEIYFDLNTLTHDVIEELQRTTDTHRLIVNSGSPAMVFADPERIGQVMTNLITNAIKYSPAADKILIHTVAKEGNALYSVQDFGIGISEEKKEKVFEQFYRVSGDMQHTFPGLGLGLYIASQIVKRARGKIWVESKEGEGATFCFSLPVHHI